MDYEKSDKVFFPLKDKNMYSLVKSIKGTVYEKAVILVRLNAT